MTKEIWKDIPSYEKLYQISNCGKIERLIGYQCNKKRSLKSKKINKYGYLMVCLCKNNKCKYFYIHRLVLEAFVGPCPSGMECRHLDGKPSNNRLYNLEWTTHNENMKDKIKHKTIYNGENNKKGSDHPNSKLINNDIFKMREMNKNGFSIKEIAELFNVCYSSAQKIIKRKSWKHI